MEKPEKANGDRRLLRLLSRLLRSLDRQTCLAVHLSCRMVSREGVQAEFLPRKDAMTHSRRDMTTEQQEACQKAQQISAIYEAFQITLDPIDWRQFGLFAPVKIKEIEIALLGDLWKRDRDDMLRQVQIKLLEQAALKTLQPQPNLRAMIWSPVEILQPQTFLSLWIITFETNERVPVIEFLSDGQRTFAPFPFDGARGRHLAQLFGPAIQGEHHPGEIITIKERGQQYTGEIMYVIAHGTMPSTRRQATQRYRAASGPASPHEEEPRYIVDCRDGFPHIAYQSQIVG